MRGVIGPRGAPPCEVLSDHEERPQDHEERPHDHEERPHDHEERPHARCYRTVPGSPSHAGVDPSGVIGATAQPHQRHHSHTL